MVSVKLTKEGPGVSMRGICEVHGRLVVVFEERTSGLNHEEDDLCKRNLQARVVKARDNKNLCC